MIGRLAGTGSIFRFATVGVAAALLFFVLAWLFVALGAPPFPGSVAAYAVAFAFAYLAQRGWTFGGVHAHARALPRYVAAQLCCAMLSGIVGYVSVEGFGATPFWMAAAATAAAGAASFLLSSFWVFSAGSR